MADTDIADLAILEKAVDQHSGSGLGLPEKRRPKLVVAWASCIKPLLLD